MNRISNPDAGTCHQPATWVSPVSSTASLLISVISTVFKCFSRCTTPKPRNTQPPNTTSRFSHHMLTLNHTSLSHIRASLHKGLLCISNSSWLLGFKSSELSFHPKTSIHPKSSFHSKPSFHSISKVFPVFFSYLLHLNPSLPFVPVLAQHQPTPSKQPNLTQVHTY